MRALVLAAALLTSCAEPASVVRVRVLESRVEFLHDRIDNLEIRLDAYTKANCR